MANEWENKDLPRAKGKIAPAQWNADSVQWEPYAGVRKLEQKLNDIDNRIKKIESGETAVNTQLTGSKVEEKTVHKRGIYKSGYNIEKIDIPDGVKQTIFMLQIYDVTGSFADDEGMTSYVRRIIGRTHRQADEVIPRFNPITISGNRGNVIFEFGTSGYGDGTRYAGTEASLFNRAQFYANISGTFTDSEGFDLESTIRFIY